MSLGLFTTKIGMSQIFLQNGNRIPITILKIKNNIIISKYKSKINKTNSLIVGFDNIKDKKINKPQKGYFIKHKTPPTKYLKKLTVNEKEFNTYNTGSLIKLNILKENLYINTTGISKGKGFSGVMKRHNFKGFNATHGTHESFRGGGSIGMCTKPGKVFKGKKMAGHLGNNQVTNKNLKIIKIINEKNLILIKGSIVGPKKSTILITISNKNKK